VNVVPIDDADLIDRLGASTGPRSRDKLHLSDIYKLLMQRLQPKRFDSSKPMDMRRVEMGLLFENMLERALMEKFGTVRPGEIVSEDGNNIYMSPDGVNPDLCAGEEYKCTYMSSSKGISEAVVVDGTTYHIPLDKFVHWFIQMKGYAKWLCVNRFILRVLFVCGDYSYPIQPQFISYDITFTDAEIDANWDELMQLARAEGLL
jgi:hypothetical protein